MLLLKFIHEVGAFANLVLLNSPLLFKFDSLLDHLVVLFLQLHKSAISVYAIRLRLHFLKLGFLVEQFFSDLLLYQK